MSLLQERACYLLNRAAVRLNQALADMADVTDALAAIGDPPMPQRERDGLNLSTLALVEMVSEAISNLRSLASQISRLDETVLVPDNDRTDLDRKTAG